MISVNIPGYGELEIKNLVLDFNGTLATGGRLIDSLKEIIDELAKKIKVYVITADTFGSVESELVHLPIEIIKLNSDDERREKLDLIQRLGPKETVSIGNGNNDEFMLKESIIGICVMGSEGCSKKALDSSDLVINSIKSALELLKYTNRLKATLRF
ncbi:ATPase P [Dehalobacter restrictus]|jgi:soluble P-type ATPase|uniref:HAD family hydrolase n=1 Tax=Dehalobacter restrictus TaxID=55583 RepID=UPI00338DBD2D